MDFVDVDHDIDSCKDVWENFYKKVYSDFFAEYFDFDELNDKETSRSCKRWYIKYKKESERRKKYPKFKMAGDCVFNFNEKKRERFDKLVSNDKELSDMLEKCCEKHHDYENFAFLPITGGMNNQKQGGRWGWDRLDLQLVEIRKYYNGSECNLFNHCRTEATKEALKDYLAIFLKYDDPFKKYCKEILFVDEVDYMIKFALNNPKIDEKNVGEYMNMVFRFWNDRLKFFENKL